MPTRSRSLGLARVDVLGNSSGCQVATELADSDHEIVARARAMLAARLGDRPHG